MTDSLPIPGFRSQPVWLLVVAAIVFGQAGLAYQFFEGSAGMNDSRPVVAGRHPLHFYHGLLGAETFRQRYATACVDPAFQAGDPKTPVFDWARWQVISLGWIDYRWAALQLCEFGQ